MSIGNTNTDGSVREGMHPTGITILDEEVLRGIPEGSTIAILGDPDSASEMIIHSLAATGRKTEYISTLRPESGLMDDIKRVTGNNADTDSIEENVTIRDVRNDTADLGDTLRKSSQVVGDGNLIVDTFSSQHDSPKDMMSLARRVYSKTKSNGGLTYLYFTATTTEDLSRYEREILQMVDGVFNVRTNVVGTDQIENNLFINKLRGVDTPGEAQTLVFGESLTIDVTADIG